MTGKPLRILLLTPQSPFPPEQGAALRNYNLLRYLAHRHAVTLVTFQDATCVPETLKMLCQSVLTVPMPRRRLAGRAAALLHPLPDLAMRLRSAAFAATVARLGQRRHFDLVQCEALELYRYASLIGAPIVLDEHNAEWRLQQRAIASAWSSRRVLPALYSFVQTAKLRRYEAAAVRASAGVIAVSDTDKDDLRIIAPGADVTVIPNGVDADLYAPPEHVSADAETILFAGKMDFRPNAEGALWLAKEVMPRVWQERPNARLVIFGKDPTPPVRRLAHDQRITVTGYVPGIEAEREALLRATVVAIPVRAGGGTRLKVLHALAMGRAVVSTPLGAAGYAFEHRRHLLLAKTDEDFAAALLDLLGNYRLRRRLGSVGRRLVVERYTWQALLPALDAVYERVLHG